MSGNSGRQRKLDVLFRLCVVACALVFVVLVAGFFVRLLISSLPAIKAFGWRFLISRDWDPYNNSFGALSSLYGTLISTVVAMVIAVPLSVAIALFLVELANPMVRKIVGTAIELLAAVPSIIFGMWGLFVFQPLMAKYIEPALGKWLGFIPLFSGPPLGLGLLTAGIILALMILPFISSVMRDIFLMTPAVVKESAYGIGATTWEVTRGITIRYGIRGMVGACFLGLGRAIGETMAVTFVIGNAPEISASLFSPGTSITSTLANEFAEATDPLHQSALIELGLILLAVSFGIQVIAHVWLRSLSKRMGAGL